MAGMIVAPSCNNQIHAIGSADSLQVCNYLLTVTRYNFALCHYPIRSIQSDWNFRCSKHLIKGLTLVLSLATMKILTVLFG